MFELKNKVRILYFKTLKSTLILKNCLFLHIYKQMVEIRPLSPFEDFVDCIDNYEENLKLKKENQTLKQNFMRMSDIIRKYNKQMIRKDNLILKLQQKYSSKMTPNLYNNKLKTQQNSSNIDGFKSLNAIQILNVLQTNLIEPFIRTEDSHLNSDKLIGIFMPTINRIVLEFRPHLIHLNEKINEMKQFFENNNEVNDNSNNLEEIFAHNGKNEEKNLQTNKNLILQYLDLKKTYDELLNENLILKSNVSYSPSGKASIRIRGHKSHKKYLKYPNT